MAKTPNAQGEPARIFEDALVLVLRNVMAMNGPPCRQDYRDLELYETHRRQWGEAKAVLETYDEGKRNG